MQSKDLENYIEFLLSAALQRCGNIYDAEDLTQETLLAALSYMARGKDIQDVKAWLLVVMGRKFNDMLRKRYKQPIVSIGDDFDTNIIPVLTISIARFLILLIRYTHSI